jgi:hypothetical protein
MIGSASKADGNRKVGTEMTSVTVESNGGDLVENDPTEGRSLQLPVQVQRYALRETTYRNR